MKLIFKNKNVLSIERNQYFSTVLHLNKVALVSSFKFLKIKKKMEIQMEINS